MDRVEPGVAIVHRVTKLDTTKHSTAQRSTRVANLLDRLNGQEWKKEAG